MTKFVRVAAAGAAALLTTAAGVLGAATATAADREYGTDGTRVTAVPAGHPWSNGTDGHDWNNGTRVTADNKDWSAGTDGTRVTSVQDDREY